MVDVVAGGIVLALLACGFALGWVARSWQFWVDEDCVNPAHKDYDE